MLKKSCRKGTPKGQTINSKVTKIVNGKQDVFTKYVNGSTSANSIWFHLKFLIKHIHTSKVGPNSKRSMGKCSEG